MLGWKHRLARLPLRRQLALVATTTSLLGVVLFAALMLALLGWTAQQNLQRQQVTLQPLLEAALTGPMIERDYARVREIAEALLQSDAIDAIAIVSSDGIAVTELRGAQPPLFSREVRLELREAGVRFGEVRLLLGAGGLIDTMAKLGLAALATGSLTLVLVSGLFRTLALRLVQRLTAVAQAAHDIAAGRLDSRVLDGGADEIGQLAHDFNRMAETVQHTVQALASSEGEKTAILQSIGDGLLTTDTAMRVTYLNPIAEALTGWPDTQARGRSVAEVFRIEHALTGQPAEIPVGRVLETGHVVELANHTVLVARDGRRHHIADSAAPIRDGSGQLTGVVMVFRDVSEGYRLRADLDSQRTRLALALQGADLGLWDRDLTTGKLVIDARWAGMLGYEVDELSTMDDPWRTLTHPDDLPVALRAYQAHLDGRLPRYEAEFRMRGKDGRWRWILSRGRITARAPDGQALRITGTHLDISERRAAQAEIERLAFFDPLTGLPNRRLLLDRLERELIEAGRERRSTAVLWIDLDEFKQINDAHGHHAGDTVLREVAQRLQRQLREIDTAARVGGDEFVIVLPALAGDVPSAAHAAHQVATALSQALTEPYDVGGAIGQYRVTASIGVAIRAAEGRDSADALSRQADTAMHEAKRRGRNAVCFFEQQMQAAVEARLSLLNDLRAAVAAESLQLYLQGQFDAHGQLIGAEVLLRWFHPERGDIPPAAFIPLAEESGLIEDLGAWVLRESARMLRQADERGRPLRLSVNISPRQFSRPDFVTRLQTILSETGADPNRLVLEITEGLLLDDVGEAAARMHELRGMGIRFSIDDFGTGYSSLAYLKRLPLHELKIDRTFVANLPHDASDAALSKTILLIAQQLQLDVVAEGVETPAQLEWLRAQGCGAFQGYLLGRPTPAHAFWQHEAVAMTPPASPAGG